MHSPGSCDCDTSANTTPGDLTTHATGDGTARLEPAILLPPPDQWLARTGTSDQAWRAIMVNYRQAHGIGRFESVPIANIEKWALEQANRHSQITMLPIMAGGTR